MRAGTLYVYKKSYIGDKLVEDMTDAEKQAFIDRYKDRGTKVIMEGFNDGIQQMD